MASALAQDNGAGTTKQSAGDNARDSEPGRSLTPGAIGGKIKEIEAREGLDEELKKEIVELYGSARASLLKAQKHRTQGDRYKADVKGATEQAQEIRRALEKEAGDPEGLALPLDATPEDLRVLLTEAQSELLAAKRELQEKDDLLEELRGRPAAITAEQVEAKERLAEIEQALKASPAAGENPLLVEANRAALEASEKAYTEQAYMLEQESLSHPMRRDLATAERDRTARRVSRFEATVKELEDVVRERKSAKAEETKLETELTAELTHPALAGIAEENARLGEELAFIVREGNAATPDKKLVEDNLAEIEDVLKWIRGNVERSGLEAVGAEALREEREQLVKILRESRNACQKWSGKLTRAKSERFRVKLLVRDLADLDEVVLQELEGKLDASMSQEEREQIVLEARSLLTKRQELLNSINESYGSYAKTLIALDTSFATLEERAAEFGALLDEWLLWIPSSELPGADTLAGLGSSITWLVAPENWQALGRTLVQDLREAPTLWVVAVLLVAVLLVVRPWARRRIRTITKKLERLATDHIGLTVWSLLLTALTVTPIPVAFLYVGWRLYRTLLTAEVAFVPAVGRCLLVLAEVVFVLRFLLQMCAPRGVADLHFLWSETVLRLIRLHLRWFLMALCVAVFLVVITRNQPDQTLSDSLGRLAFIALLVAQAVFVQRLARPRGGVAEHVMRRNPNGWVARLRYLWYPIVVLFPFALAVMAATGYYYTALVLEGLMIRSAWLIFGTIIGYWLVRRFLVIAQRRLMAEREQEVKEQATGDDGESGTDSSRPELHVLELDISTINEQSRALLGTVVTVGLLIGLWVIWGDVLPALSFFDSVRLWSTTVPGKGGTPITEWITLEHLGLALVLLALALGAAKNLPGLLEILILKTLPLAPMTRYAIATLSQYVLVSIGVIVAANTIGVDWGKIQWLIAALSVGLGFGLQEIIANFVCGLILLFERPIRIGDIVKVGDVMGTVSRIRIRATTITDWDRMEYVVPNKELITGRLFNWTLSNTLNRIVIKVGIKRSSDPERARQLLLKVAGEHPKITEDPGPLATLEGFGTNTFDLILRCYLEDFADRLQVISELHMAVSKAFSEAGIEIALPQLDLLMRGGDFAAGRPDATETTD